MSLRLRIAVRQSLGAAVLGALTLATSASGADLPTPDVRRQPNPTAGRPNIAHEQLLKASETERATAFAQLLTSSGKDCLSARRTFYQGSAANGDAFWDVACTNDKAFAIQIKSDADGSTRIMDCETMKAIHVGECFKPFPSSPPQLPSKGP